ncbi:hypothetical protein SAMN06297251_10284 [Fulvimarina manganoxydans]|uniref:Uncharacterized protein n=1 Tax=Fulvimarina manganoxydans TaxID=937218 RepID=A0A1W1YY27_9HYPH|nr:hypothetical protein [Fulvimarina manganoxydans]SMC41115.1 hypothetical protein SAMN06297251_10284 [Fulvimarina manganoxydans]
MTDTSKLVEMVAEVNKKAWEDFPGAIDAKNVHEARLFAARRVIEALSSAQADADQRVKAAVEAERERCALVVDDFGKTWGLAYRSGTNEIAAAIRAGKEDSHAAD